MPYKEQDVGRAVREIANEVINRKNVKDNVTVIVIALNRGKRPV